MLTKGLRCRQVNFSCEESHDRHKKTDGAGAVWVSLIDFGFSQQSMFRCWHLCLNEAAPSIKARGRGRFLPVGGCESMQQNRMLFWINEAPQPKATRQRGARGKCNFFPACVVVVVSSLTVMDGADMMGWRKCSDYIRGRKRFETTGDTIKDIQKREKRKGTTEMFWIEVREHFTTGIYICYCSYKRPAGELTTAQ